MIAWGDVKDFVEFYTGLERDALHIHAALLLYIVAMGVFRQSRRSRLPWLVVLAVELANEAHDLYYNFDDLGAEAARRATATDLWNTMLWPTVLLVVGRYTTWFQPRHRGVAARDPDAAPEPAAEAPD